MLQQTPSSECLQVIRVLHMHALSRAARDLRRLRIVANIDQFHAQIAKLLAYVFIFVHWNACLQYGSCTAQGARRQGCQLCCSPLLWALQLCPVDPLNASATIALASWPEMKPCCPLEHFLEPDSLALTDQTGSSTALQVPSLAPLLQQLLGLVLRHHGHDRL